MRVYISYSVHVLHHGCWPWSLCRKSDE